MKRIKKMLSVMLAMAMTLAMTIPVLATEYTPTGNTKDNTEGTTGSFTITVNDDTDGYKYDVYQIFAGDLNDVAENNKTLSNIRWGKNVDIASANALWNGQSAKDIAKTLAGSASENQETAEAKDFAKKIAGCLTGAPVGESDDFVEGTGYEIRDLAPGYYLIRNSRVSANGVYTDYILEVVGNVSPTPKRDIPKPNKQIVEGEDEVSANEASIGDEVNYKITGTMPSNISDYKEYYYLFTDTLSKGLTFKSGSIAVSVNGVDVTNYFSTREYDPEGPENQDPAVGRYDAETGTVIRVGINNLKGLSGVAGEITAKTEVILTYTAILNDKAVIAGNGNVNDVKLTYSNDPNNSGDGTTTPPDNPDVPNPTHPIGESPKVEVVTYTTQLKITKVDEDGNVLPGAGFTLTGNGVNVIVVKAEKYVKVEDGEDGKYWKLKNGTYTETAPTIAEDETDNTADYADVDTKYNKTEDVEIKGTGQDETKVTGIIQQDGTITFQGLGAGEYKIEETTVPAGYNKCADIEFTVSWTKDNGFDNTNKEKITLDKTNNVFNTRIENNKGSLLPSTGGIGTTIFYIVGAVLVIGAAILLVTKKRMSKEA